MPGWPGGLNGTQAFDSTTYPSVDIPYLQLMLKWHQQDPVSQKEIDRNNAAYNYQGNRNPFIDHPEYAAMTWNSTCPGLTTLPVSLLSFGGKLVGGTVQLEWIAVNELNFDRYEIERSVNGVHYTKIGEVKAVNQRNYSYSDNTELHRGQRVYYRLRKVDKDGSATLSAVFSLHIPLNTKFKIYPNPASDFIQLQMNRNATGELTIRITDLSGKILQNRSIKANGNTVTLNTSSLWPVLLS